MDLIRRVLRLGAHAVGGQRAAERLHLAAVTPMPLALAHFHFPCRRLQGWRS